MQVNEWKQKQKQKREKNCGELNIHNHVTANVIFLIYIDIYIFIAPGSLCLKLRTSIQKFSSNSTVNSVSLFFPISLYPYFVVCFKSIQISFNFGLPVLNTAYYIDRAIQLMSSRRFYCCCVINSKCLEILATAHTVQQYKWRVLEKNIYALRYWLGDKNRPSPALVAKRTMG